MFYYEVIVNSHTYQGKEALTYHSSAKLAVGTIVRVPLRRQHVLGFVVHSAAKPKFATKPLNALDLPGLPEHLVKLAEWLPAYYPAGLGSVGQQFLPRKLPARSLAITVTRPETEARKPDQAELPPLTAEQKTVITRIDKPDTYLLHGETGSGKTRVYIELARREIEEGKSVIVLTPEIGLTPQLAMHFMAAFGEHVLVTHSRLGEAERRRLWLKMLAGGMPRIVIGPRSALFSPLENVGLIVIDESHETSYKQEQAPHYHAAKVAAKLSSLHRAKLILGSATPSVTDYFLASEKHKPILRMTRPARTSNFSPPHIQLVKLRDREQFTRRPHLSDELLGAIEQALKAGEQSLLFLNRRGTARIVLCEACGWQATCEHCGLPLIYHGDSHTMRCHTCGRTMSAVSACPVCMNAQVSLKSVGTKAIVDEVTTFLPQANVKRFDTDNKTAERIEQQYQAIKDGSIDILVGTQILAKGLDLPKLSVIGVIIADSSLYFPDYTASERTYQLLRQVIGRVGRGHRNGRVIIQTYTPENSIIQTASRNSWAQFYEKELADREKFLFPPYCHVLKLSCRSASSASGRRKAEQLVSKLRSSGLRAQIDGPAPSIQEKVSGKYQWQLVIKSRQRTELIKVIDLLPSGWSHDIDPTNLL